MTRARRRRSTPAAAALVLLALLALTGCGASTAEEPPADSESDTESDSDADPAQVDAVELPELGACRVLGPEDVAQASDATQTVPCTEDHTAETYAVGQLPGALDDAEYDDSQMGAFAYDTCSTRFERFLGADESLVLRTVLTWAWFRPSEDAWDDGARWYRCDVVGGGEQSEDYAALPTTARGLLQGRSLDRWMVCSAGDTVSGSPKVPCSEEHQWRAVTTIKVGEDGDPYPGDRVVEVTTRDYCSESVGAWLNYPVNYDYSYTFFHEAEWQAGNRRSVCWARTPD